MTSAPTARATTAPTLVDVLGRLSAEGYTADLRITPDGELRRHPGTRLHDPAELVIESTARFEGASDPDDQAVVFGVRCPGCGLRGAIVAAYGPTATAAEAAVVTALLPQPVRSRATGICSARFTGAPAS